MDRIEQAKQHLLGALVFHFSPSDAETLVSLLDQYVNAKLDDLRAEIQRTGIHSPDY